MIGEPEPNTEPRLTTKSAFAAALGFELAPDVSPQSSIQTFVQAREGGYFAVLLVQDLALGQQPAMVRIQLGAVADPRAQSPHVRELADLTEVADLSDGNNFYSERLKAGGYNRLAALITRLDTEKQVFADLYWQSQQSRIQRRVRDWYTLEASPNYPELIAAANRVLEMVDEAYKRKDQ